MDLCISTFIEKEMDEVQNEITKEIKQSTIALDIKDIDTVLLRIKNGWKWFKQNLEP